MLMKKHAILLTTLALLTAGCTPSVVDEEERAAPRSVVSPASSQEHISTPDEDVQGITDELERADRLAESRALELARSLVIAREGWPAARCVPTRKGDGWSVLVSRYPREKLADNVIVEVSHGREVLNYRFAR